MFLNLSPAPKTPPHNVAVEWLPDATAMRVSFTRLSIVEANSINITYTIRYSSSPFTLKRESQIMMVEVKMMDNTTVIGGLSPTLDYHVVVDATNNHGTMSSTPQMLQAGMKHLYFSKLSDIGIVTLVPPSLCLLFASYSIKPFALTFTVSTPAINLYHSMIGLFLFK